MRRRKQAATMFVEYMQQSNELHQEYLENTDLQHDYDIFTRWQVNYFLRAFEDLRVKRGYREAIDFTVTDFVGTRVSSRDAEVTRAAPVFTKLLPLNALQALCAAARLNARSLEINLDVCKLLASDQPISEQSYALAYRRASTYEECIELTQLTVDLGQKIKTLVKIPLLSATLKAMHIPAHAAGFGALQTFLETGYATFRSIPDIDHFLQEVQDRLAAIFEQLFYGDISELDHHEADWK